MRAIWPSLYGWYDAYISYEYQLFLSNRWYWSRVLPPYYAKKQFWFLLLSLQFDNVNTRDGWQEFNRLAAIWEIYEKFLNIREAYLPSKHLIVNKMIVPFRGRCPFKVYMPKKPTKYSIKV